MTNDDTAQGFERTLALAKFEVDREWLLNPFRPFWERWAKQFDAEEREAIANTFQNLVDQLKREIN